MASSKKSKRVCFCVSSHPKLQLGGVQIQCGLLAEELRKMEFEINFTSEDFGQKNTELINGDLVHKIHNPMPIKYIRILTKRLGLFSALESADADIYHQMAGVNRAWKIQKFTQMKKRKMVFTAVHIQDCNFDWVDVNQMNRLSEYLYRRALSKVDAVVCLARYMKEELDKNFGVNSKVIKVGHPVPEGPFRKDRIVVWAARLDRWKKPLKFVKLAKEFSSSDVKFVMVGPTAKTAKPGFDKLVKKEASKVENLEFIPGGLSDSEIEELYSRALFFVNTSSSEGFPNTYVQSWMRETPVVALTVDPDGVIRKNQIGFHSETFERMVEQCKSLIENDFLRARMGKRARKYAIREHNIEIMAKQYSKLYNSIT